jgi:CBS domain containing-hemolysin-like protein
MNDLQVLMLFFLLAVDLLVTAARSGMLNVRQARLLSLREEYSGRVETTIKLIDRRARLRSTFRLLQSLLRFLMAGLIISGFIPGGALSIALGSLFIILALIAALIWFVEFVIERAVLRDPEAWAIRFTPFTGLLVSLFSPFLIFPMWLAEKTGTAGRNMVTISEEELKSVVGASQEAGLIELDESKMIHSVFRLGDTLAREIMVPRIDVFALDVATPLEVAVDMTLKSGFSRVPVFEENIDSVLGLLYVKDFLKVWREGSEAHSLQSLLRPAKFVPEVKKIDELLAEMQSTRTHIAIVVDEYGGVAGLVTLEDIVEEIFGEIQDEYDQGEALAYRQVENGEFIFDGRIDLDDFNEILESDLPTDEADTLGGFIYSHVGRIPKTGESIQLRDVTLKIEQIINRRIRKVRVIRTEPHTQEISEDPGNANN